MSFEEKLEERGELEGHKGWVTAVACPPDPSVPPTERIVTASRDKTLISWKLRTQPTDDGRAKLVGYPLKRLHGHSHHVEDVTVSSDGQFALSGSWDNSLRLWDLSSGITSRTFSGHKKDVMSIAFSTDNRQIVSASRDKTIRIWNTLGECKLEFGPDQNGHTDWVSCVRFSPDQVTPVVVSCGWDKKIKVWDLTSCQLKCDLVGHTGYINTISVSPDGSLCASGGKDGTAILWDLTEAKRLYSLESGDIIHALCFSPNHYWLCAATQSSIKIWDLESKNVVFDLKPESFEGKFQSKKAIVPYCVSLTWSADGTYLFGGYTDGVVRIWEVVTGGGIKGADFIDTGDL